jgi:hypothetical protein
MAMPIENPSSVTDGWLALTVSSQSRTYADAALTASTEYSIEPVSGNQEKPGPMAMGARTDATAKSSGSMSARLRRSCSFAP